MCSLIHNGIKCNGVYLQRCFIHLKLLRFIEKLKISEINIISFGCPKNYMKYGILEKKTPAYRDSQKLISDIGIGIHYLPCYKFTVLCLSFFSSAVQHFY